METRSRTVGQESLGLMGEPLMFSNHGVIALSTTNTHACIPMFVLPSTLLQWYCLMCGLITLQSVDNKRLWVLSHTQRGPLQKPCTPHHLTKPQGSGHILEEGPQSRLSPSIGRRALKDCSLDRTWPLSTYMEPAQDQPVKNSSVEGRGSIPRPAAIGS